MLRIVSELGQRLGLHVWCHVAAYGQHHERGQRTGVGLDQIRSFSRHRTLTTMLIYRDEHDRTSTRRTVADIVAATLEVEAKADP